jgi:hypothetical protein
MGIAFKQTVQHEGSTVVTMGTQTVGAYNIVGILYGNSAVTITTVTDTKGNPYTRIALASGIGPGTDSVAALYGAPVKVGGSGNTITVAHTGGTASFPYIQGSEYTGIDWQNPFYGGFAIGPSSAGPAQQGIVGKAVGDLLYCVGPYTDNDDTIAVVAGNTLRGALSATNKCAAADRLVTIAAAGPILSLNVGFTIGSTERWTLTGAGFRCAQTDAISGGAV